MGRGEGGDFSAQSRPVALDDVMATPVADTGTEPAFTDPPHTDNIAVEPASTIAADATPPAVDGEVREWWTVFGAWRGEPRLFARIATAAGEQLTDHGIDHHELIEFVVDKDTERFASVLEYQRGVTGDALRTFTDARIVLDAGPVTVEVGFPPHRGRRMLGDGDSSRGVFVRVAPERRHLDAAAADVRDALAVVVARGTVRWLAKHWAAPESGQSEAPDAEAIRAALVIVGSRRVKPINNVWLAVMAVVAVAASASYREALSLPGPS